MIKFEISDEEAQKLGITEREHNRFFKTLFVGATLRTETHSIGFGDSVSNAIVWDETTQSIQVENYQYTGLGGSDYNHAEEDATPEVWAKVKAHVFSRVMDIIRNSATGDAQSVERGKLVEVVKGRKYPKGQKAVVKFTGEGQYGFYARLTFTGGALDGEEGFIDLGNVDVVNPGQYMPSEEKIAEIAEKTWRGYVGHQICS